MPVILKCKCSWIDPRWCEMIFFFETARKQCYSVEIHFKCQNMCNFQCSGGKKYFTKRVCCPSAIAVATNLVPCHAIESLQLIWRLGTRRWNLWGPDMQMSCRDLIWRQLRRHDPIITASTTCLLIIPAKFTQFSTSHNTSDSFTINHQTLYQLSFNWTSQDSCKWH